MRHGCRRRPYHRHRHLHPNDGDNLAGPHDEDGVVPFLVPSPADDDDFLQIFVQKSIYDVVFRDGKFVT